MLVVADETAIGRRRERRLAGSRKAEEQRRVARLPDIRRAMHREHALAGEQIVHDGEHRFLQLAGVTRASDENRPLGEVENDERTGPRTVPRGNGLELRLSL